MATRYQQIYSQSQNSLLDYNINWEEWLEGDTLLTSTWTVSDLSLIEYGNNFIAYGLTTIWLYGGDVGTIYSITNNITTVGGKIDNRTFYLKITE